MGNSRRIRKFSRPLGNRRYRKLFIIASEGSKTEPCYFRILNSFNAIIHVECLFDRHKSAPNQVLTKMEDRLKKERLGKTDEAWIVIDKDTWEEKQLQQLYEWSQTRENYDLAVSNPKFEYWLLLHFEDGLKITAQNCSDRLRKYLPNYVKCIDKSKISTDSILEAIKRAKVRDTDHSMKWPINPGSTVYKLVENILKA